MNIHKFHSYEHPKLSSSEIEKLIHIISNQHYTSVPQTPSNVFSKIQKLPHSTTVIFDIYGTLLHSAAGEILTPTRTAAAEFIVPELNITASFATITPLFTSYVLASHNIKKKKDHSIYPEIDAIEIWKHMSTDENFPTKKLTNFEAALCAVYYELYTNPTTMMPDAMHVLCTLQKHGYTLGIVSNAQFYTPLFIEALFSSSPCYQELSFPIQVWSYLMSEAKPSVTLFNAMLEQCSQFNISREEIVYIGNDMKNDMFPASQVGIHTVLFAGDSLSYRPRHDDAEISQTSLDATITSLREILDILAVPK